MDKKKKKTKLLNFKGLRIEARLRKAFNIIISIAAAGLLIGIRTKVTFPRFVGGVVAECFISNANAQNLTKKIQHI